MTEFAVTIDAIEHKYCRVADSRTEMSIFACNIPAMIQELKEFLPQIIATVIALVVLYLSKYLIGRLISSYGSRQHKTEIRMKQIKQVIFILINIVFIFIIAVTWGVAPKNLLMSLSSVFVVLGVAFFAQWSILSNISAGIIMFFNAPFRIGDHIRIIDKDVPIEAEIENIHTFYVHLRTPEDELIVLPNNVFLQKVVSIRESEREF